MQRGVSCDIVMRLSASGFSSDKNNWAHTNDLLLLESKIAKHETTDRDKKEKILDVRCFVFEAVQSIFSAVNIKTLGSSRTNWINIII